MWSLDANTDCSPCGHSLMERPKLAGPSQDVKGCTLPEFELHSLYSLGYFGTTHKNTTSSVTVGTALSQTWLASHMEPERRRCPAQVFVPLKREITSS